VLGPQTRLAPTGCGVIRGETHPKNAPSLTRTIFSAARQASPGRLMGFPVSGQNRERGGFPATQGILCLGGYRAARSRHAKAPGDASWRFARGRFCSGWSVDRPGPAQWNDGHGHGRLSGQQKGSMRRNVAGSRSVLRC